MLNRPCSCITIAKVIQQYIKLPNAIPNRNGLKPDLNKKLHNKEYIANTQAPSDNLYSTAGGIVK